jgi:hypothetical protein
MRYEDDHNECEWTKIMKKVGLALFQSIRHHHHQWRYSPDRALASLNGFRDK